MTHIRIDAADLAARGFRLQLQNRSGDIDVVELAPSGGVTGSYEHDDERIGLRGIRAGELSVARLRWAVPGGTVETTAPARIVEAAIDAVIATRPTGDLPPMVGTIRAGTASGDLDVELGEMRARARGVELSGLDFVTRPQGQQSITAQSAAIARIDIDVNDITVHLRDVLLPDGLHLSGERCNLGSLSVGHLAVSVREPVRRSARAKSRQGGLVDLPFLDHLTGRINADVKTDVTLPIFGRRKATHRFRIAVRNGTIDFAALESNLSFLEDLALHFKVRKGKLVLEKNIPFIPFDRKTLVYWQLDEEGLAMAEKKCVRLRTLLQPNIANHARDEDRRDMSKDGGNGVHLRHLEVAGIDVLLRLGGPTSLSAGGGIVRLGGGSHSDTPSIGELSVRGELHHRNGPGDQAGTLELMADSVAGGLDGVAIGDWRVDAARVAIGRIHDVRVELQGLEPRALQLTARGIAMGDVALRRQTSIDTAEVVEPSLAFEDPEV